MKVKLKQAIMEEGRVKASVRRNKNWEPPKVVKEEKDGKSVERLETCPLPETVVVAFVEGAELEVSEATGKKWIKKGWAEAVELEPAQQQPAVAPTPAKPEGKKK